MSLPKRTLDNLQHTKSCSHLHCFITYPENEKECPVCLIRKLYMEAREDFSEYVIKYNKLHKEIKKTHPELLL